MDQPSRRLDVFVVEEVKRRIVARAIVGRKQRGIGIHAAQRPFKNPCRPTIDGAVGLDVVPLRDRGRSVAEEGGGSAGARPTRNDRCAGPAVPAKCDPLPRKIRQLEKRAEGPSYVERAERPACAVGEDRPLTVAGRDAGEALT